MKEQNCAEEIENILKEAPAARNALLENYNNLRNVAEYCENSYLQVSDFITNIIIIITVFKTSVFETSVFETSVFETSVFETSVFETSVFGTSVFETSVFETPAGGDTNKALEETKAFTTQSLASVAYQISTLATSTVDMHREKVARREIGAFTVAKRYTRSSKIIPPAGGNDPKPKYSRTPITYSHLDTLGHGMKDSKPQERKATINRKHGGTLSSSFGKAVPPPVAPSWPVTPETDIISTLLEDTPPPPPLPINGEEASEIVVAPPLAPPPDICDFLPPPPSGNPMEETQELEPAPLLETVLEETGFPPTEVDEVALPAPPPPPPGLHFLENGEGTENLLKSTNTSRLSVNMQQSDVFIIPPPPPYPPPLAPATSNLLCRIPARLQHLDLEIPVPPPPPPPMDCMDGFEEIPPLPPPVDYDTSAPVQYLEKVVALYSYEAGKPGDLTFQEGDVIYLTKRNDDGWCEGVLNGVEGFFPGNYVESTS
ncbi:Abl interactor 1 [Bagarius yarrelli]|uniref:ABI gene family member 3 n=1 Tax=Bagarius yarrelli TaxID=175774 RepID=A0A556UZJ2_BAGYA|nr:Abl interactor 1 [Bagarius yarrelli]